MSQHNLGETERKIKGVAQAVAALKISDEMKELLLVIHRPGWTTPAEIGLVNGLLDSLTAQIQAIGQVSQTLMSGARAVGQK